MTEEQNKLAEEEPEAMKWFRKGRESVLRKNQSGCCCLFNEEDEIVSVCAAHEEWAAEREPATEAVRDQVLEEAAKACAPWESDDNPRRFPMDGDLLAAAIRALKGKGASQGDEVVVTTDEAGACIAVTRQDDEGRILKVIWTSQATKQNYIGGLP